MYYMHIYMYIHTCIYTYSVKRYFREIIYNIVCFMTQGKAHKPFLPKPRLL